METMKQNEDIRGIGKDDPRPALLEAEDGANWEGSEVDVGDPEDDEGLSEVGTPEDNVLAEREGSGLTEYLQKQTKSELVSMLVELAKDFEVVDARLADRRNLATGKPEKILGRLRKTISALDDPPWNDRGFGAPARDLDRLASLLKRLMAAGHAESAMPLGLEILTAGVRRLEWEHEGESWDGISNCMEVLFEGVANSRLSAPEKVEWSLDLIQEDPYDLCDAGLDWLWSASFSKRDWSDIADRLEVRLNRLGTTRKSARDYDPHRRLLVDWIVDALANAGRPEEIIPLCEREADITFSYARLVDLLIAERRWEEAAQWCHHGIEATVKKLPGIAADLRRRSLTRC